jgi:hypothetical protein
VSASVRIVDNGINAALYASNMNFIYYIVRNMLPNTFHEVIGPMSISAYNSQTSNRPMYSIRASPTLLQPVLMVRNPVPPNAAMITADDAVNNKLVFIMSLFIL